MEQTMKSMSTFEKTVLNYMNAEWGERRYCRVKDILEENIPDFRFQVVDLGAENVSIQVFSSDVTPAELTTYQNNEGLNPQRLKCSDRFQDIFAVYNLLEYLEEEDYILINQSLDDKHNLPNPLIYESPGIIPNMVDPFNVLDDFYFKVKRYHNAHIFAERDLLEYISNGFKTPEDIKQAKDERRYRFQRTITYITTFIAIATGISSIILGILNLK